MKDRSLRRKLEADFTEYYGVDIRDLFDPSSKMTVRWVISHLENLPYGSRISKHFNDDDFTYNEHLLADLVDVLRVNTYFNSLSAAAAIGKDFQKYAKKSPERMERPKILTKEKEPIVFSPISAAREIFGGG